MTKPTLTLDEWHVRVLASQDRIDALMKRLETARPRDRAELQRQLQRAADQHETLFRASTRR
jgi:hypothetical protein